MGNIFTIPNIISLSRVALLPFFIFFVFQEKYLQGFIIFLAGSVSDCLDGYAARKLNQITPLGKFIDPFADKMFFTLSLAVFSYKGLLPLWFFALIFARDFLVALGSLLYIKKRGLGSITPHFSGKLVNFFEFLIITAVLTENAFDIWFITFLHPPFIYLCAFFSIWSFAVYFSTFIKISKQQNL